MVYLKTLKGGEGKSKYSSYLKSYLCTSGRTNLSD